MVQELNSLQDFEDVINNNKLCIVLFFAEWCNPCKMIKPFFEECANNFESKMPFFKVNVEVNEDASDRESIHAMPTFVIYKDGRRWSELIGFDELKLEVLIRKQIS